MFSISQRSELTLLPSIWCAAVDAPQRKPLGKVLRAGAASAADSNPAAAIPAAPAASTVRRSSFSPDISPPSRFLSELQVEHDGPLPLRPLGAVICMSIAQPLWRR